MKTPLLILLASLVAGCSASPAARDSIADPGQLLFNGYTHKNVDCYSCHAGDATGTWKGPNLVHSAAKKPREKLAKAIRKGPGIMPAFKDKLTDPEVGEILDWIESLK